MAVLDVSRDGAHYTFPRSLEFETSDLIGRLFHNFVLKATVIAELRLIAPRRIYALHPIHRSRPPTTTPRRNLHQPLTPIPTPPHNNTTPLKPPLPTLIPFRPQTHPQPLHIHKHYPAHICLVNYALRHQRYALRPYVLHALGDFTDVEQFDAEPAAHVGAVVGEGYARSGGDGGEEVGGGGIGGEECVEGGGAGLGVERGGGGEAGQAVRGEGGGELGEGRDEEGGEDDDGEMDCGRKHVGTERVF